MFARARPTEELPAPARPARVALIVALTLLSFAVVNFAIGRALRHYTTNLGYYLIAYKWRLLLEQDEPASWLILGDSTCNQGVDPDVFDRSLRVSSLNLCTNASMQVLNDAWMLQEHVDRFGPPEGVVVIHTHDAWATNLGGGGGSIRRGPLAAGMAQIPLPWGFWERTAPGLDLSAEDERLVFLGRYAPVYAQNRTLRTWARNPTGAAARVRRRRFEANGFMPREASPGRARGDAGNHLKYVKRHRFRVAPWSRKALTAMEDLAKRHRFPLYIAHSPIVSTLEKQPAFRRYAHGMSEELERLTRGNEYVHYLDYWVTFPTKDMDQADHVSWKAAVKFTQELARSIQRTHPREAKERGRSE